MALFAPAFEYLMSNEDPGLTGRVISDSGGLTRWGISQRSYPDLDIRNLEYEKAGEIYRDDFFRFIRGYDIDSQPVASKLLDMAVNMGKVTAVHILQQILAVSVDGAVGPETLDAVNKYIQEELLQQLVDHSITHYRAIAAARPDEAKDLKGWLARAAKLPAV